MTGSLYYNTAGSVNCPDCNNPIASKSAHTNIIVCPSCNTIIEKKEDDTAAVINNISTSKIINNSMIGIGTKGIYNKKSFEITGCLRCDMKRFYCNRWTVLYADGSIGMLTETLSFYAVHEKVTVDFPGQLQLVRSMEIGVDFQELLKGRRMQVFDKAKCETIFAEGEVLSPDTDGAFIVTELGDEIQRLEVIEHSKGNYSTYLINYVLLSDLSLSNKNTNRITPVTLTCASCRKPVSIKLPQYSDHVVCPHCNKWNEKQGTQLHLRDKDFKAFKPGLPIGSKGQLKGIDYEVMNAAIKYESGSIETTWREYSLYNEQTGFAFLAEYNGHWTYLKEVKLGSPWPLYQQEIIVDNESYVLFNDYSFKITAAAGEFFIPLNIGGSIRAKEFISPPEMYAAENNEAKEITWYKGEYLTNKEVFEGLNLADHSMPLVTGIGPLQPMKGYTNMRLLKRMSLIALAVFLTAQVILSFTAKNEIVFDQDFFIPDSMSSRGIVSQPFQLKAASSNLEFYISAPVGNSWFDADITLINDKTGKEYNIDKGVEYYSGYSDGERWTEGTQDADAMLSAVPAGTYHMNIFTSAGGENKVNSFSIRVRNDVPMWRNFIFIVLIAGLYPLIQWGRTQLFEKRRWNNGPDTEQNEA